MITAIFQCQCGEYIAIDPATIKECMLDDCTNVQTNTNSRISPFDIMKYQACGKNLLNNLLYQKKQHIENRRF